MVIINNFVSNTQAVALGGKVTLSWNTTGAAMLTLTDGPGNAIDISGAGMTGSIDVTISTLANTFTLTAHGAEGSAVASVNVIGCNLTASIPNQASKDVYRTR